MYKYLQVQVYWICHESTHQALKLEHIFILLAIKIFTMTQTKQGLLILFQV